MQISYNDIDDTSSNNTRTVSIFGETYDVYARSYLCYGINEASRRILAYAVKVVDVTSVDLTLFCFI